MRECTVEDLQTDENSHRGAPNKDFRLDRKKKTLLSFSHVKNSRYTNPLWQTEGTFMSTEQYS